VSITIELPDLAEQRKFNLARWTEILADLDLAKLPYCVETDQHGHVVMTPPPAPIHGNRQARIGALLVQLLPEGETFTECPVSTAGGVKSADVAWIAPDWKEKMAELVLFERAPEICVEVLSPSNSAAEINERRTLYFDAGASEVWICNLNGSVSFFVGSGHAESSTSVLCPAFPSRIR
jgi:Uma2 family endonuclease